LLSDKIIKIGDFIYRVYEYTDNMELEIGNAYLIGGKFRGCIIRYKYILPFLGELQKTSEEPGIYITKKNKHHIIHPSNDKEFKIYSINRIFEINPKSINTTLDKYLSEIDLTDLRYTGNLFQPKIKEADDIGIAIVRLAISLKQIDFNTYANKMARTWDRANLRKALEKDTTLTFSKLKQYADIFDFDYGIIIFDKDNAKNPISKDGKAIVMFNDSEYGIADDNIVIVNDINSIMVEKDVDNE